MAIPTARVKVELLKITGLPAVTLPAGATRYARAYFFPGGRTLQTGRSRPIPDAGGDLNLATEAVPWSFEANVNPGDKVGFRFETCEDRGDKAAPPATWFGSGYYIEDPWSSGVRTFGSGPTVHVRVTTTLVNPVDKAFLARATGSSKPSGTLAVPQGYIVEIVDIIGLYKPLGNFYPGLYVPGLPMLPGTEPPAGSARAVGYISEDNLGRIFTNRKPDGTWAKDTQFIDIQVKVTAFGGLTIPAGAKTDWTIEDADDPTNEASDFHRQWGRYVDQNDYDSTGKPLGAHAADNAAAFKPGNTDESKLFGAAARSSLRARWAQVTGGPALDATSRTRAKTAINLVTPKSATSSVRIHCMNVLGTNLRVRANLIGTPAGKPVFNALSGVMTMWSRIDVEVVRMAGAHSVSGAIQKIAKFFLPACVQLDFQPERVVTGALDKAQMATSDDDSVFDPALNAWTNHSSVFSHKGQPGWFFLGAARLPYPLPPSGPVAPLVTVTGTHYTLSATTTVVSLEVDGSAAAAEFVQFTWPGSGGASHSAGFSVKRKTTTPVDIPVVSGGKTKMKLWGNDVSPDFTGHDSDGSIDHAYASIMVFFPRHQWPTTSLTLVPGGYGIPLSGATVTVFGPGAVFTTGVSPSVKNPTTPSDTKEYFAGRTILFTHTDSFSEGTPPHPKADFNQEVLGTVVHEFIHAFGMPHKCGNWSWRTPREPGGRSCCMNYFNTWLLDASKNLIPGTVGRQGNDMCGRHLMEVRRVHLEKNKGLRW